MGEVKIKPPKANFDKILFSKIDNIEVADVFPNDYPDYVDAYLESFDYDGKPASQELIDYVNENHPHFVYISVLDTLNEVKIKPPSRIHNLDQRGVLFNSINVGDTLQFTLYAPQKETVKQKVTSIISPINLASVDLDDYGQERSGTDIWNSYSIEHYWEKSKNRLNEYSAGIINSTLERWGISPEDTEETNRVKILINDFERKRDSITNRLDLVTLPDRLKQGQNYLDITKYSLEEIEALLRSLPENPEKIKKAAIENFVKKDNVDKEIAKSYTSRFMQNKNALKSAVQNGIEESNYTAAEVKALIPRQLLQKEAYLDPRNWRFTQLENLLDVLFPAQRKSTDGEENTASTDADNVYNQNGLEIYKADSAHKCISYNPRVGEKNKPKYGWCVANMEHYYMSYRLKDKSPTFYIVFNRDKPSTPDHAKFDDKWHAFVIQAYADGETFAITNADNYPMQTDVKNWNELSNAVDSETWNKIKNLKDYFKPIPLTSDERAEKMFKGKDLTIGEFKELSQEDKKLYIQNKAPTNRLSIDILRILPRYKVVDLEGRSTTLANIAIDAGQKFPYDVLKDQEALAKRYAIVRVRNDDYNREPIPLPFIKYLNDESKQEYLSKFEDNLSFELIQTYFGEDTLKLVVNKQAAELGFLPEDYIKYITDPKLKALYGTYSKLYENWIQDNGYNNLELINNSLQMPEQSITPSAILYKQWILLSSKEKSDILKLIKSTDTKKKYTTFLYAAPFIIKDGSNEYILLPKSRTGDLYEDWILIDINDKIIKDNIEGDSSTIGSQMLSFGYFSTLNQEPPKRIYSADDVKLNSTNVKEANSLYEDWDRYQLMVKAGIIK